MRLRELIETRQLNEVAPLAFLAPMLPAGLAWIATVGLGTIALWSISAIGTVMTAREIQKAVEENGPNPSNWPTELQDDLLGQLIGAALFSALPAAKPAFQKAWRSIPKSMKDEAIQKIAPKVEAEIAKKIKDPNKIDKPFSKDPTSTPKDPNKIDRPFSKDAGTTDNPKVWTNARRPDEPATTTPTPKNPNWTEKPFQKEELLRLAGMAK